MIIDFRKMMSEGIEYYDPTNHRVIVKGDTKGTVPRYFFFDKQTGIRVSYSIAPAYMEVYNAVKMVCTGNPYPSEPVDCSVVCRAFMNRFLQTFPSTRVSYRLSAMCYFLLNELNSTRLGSSQRFDVRIGESKEFIHRYTTLVDELGDKQSSILSNRFSAKHFTLRKDRFNHRERMYRRLKDEDHDTQWKIQQFVQSYHNHCASLSKNSVPLHNAHPNGWTYNYDTKTIEVTDKRSVITKKIELTSIDPRASNVIPVQGIDNCFCAIIEEKIGETYYLRLLNRNLNLYGYICTDKTLEGQDTRLGSLVCIHSSGGNRIMLSCHGGKERVQSTIGSTKLKAMALLLSRS